MRNQLIINLNNNVQYFRHTFMWNDKKCIPLIAPDYDLGVFSNEDIVFLYDLKNKPVKTSNTLYHKPAYNELYFIKYYDPTNLNIKLKVTRTKILDYLEYLNWEK